MYVTTLPLFLYVPYNKTDMLSHSIGLQCSPPFPFLSLPQSNLSLTGKLPAVTCVLLLLAACIMTSPQSYLAWVISTKNHTVFYSCLALMTSLFYRQVLSRVLELKRHMKKRHGYQSNEDNPDQAVWGGENPVLTGLRWKFSISGTHQTLKQHF